jgi:hypothetical protein
MIKRLIYTAGLIGFVFLLAHCSDDTVEPPLVEPLTPEQLARADSISTNWFMTLYDTMLSLSDYSADDMRDIRFDSMRSGFEQAVGIESGNEMGNLGLALIELLEVNYSDVMWAFVDSLESWVEGDSVFIPFPPLPDFSTDRHRTLIGNQFQLMVEMPMLTIARVAAAPDNISFGTVQDIIADEIIPKLNNAISHMNRIHPSNSDGIRLCFDYDEFPECLRFDMGELMVFSAGFYALRSAMNSAIAYDVDFLGPDGTYEWVRDYLDAEYGDHYGFYQCYRHNLIELGAIDDLELIWYNSWQEHFAIADSILVSIAYYNVETRTDFLSLRNGGTPLRNAHADMLMAFTRLEQAAAYIRDPNRDETEENVIKLGDLTDFDSELQNDPDVPNFMQGWNSLEDVIAFGKEFLAGPYEFNEEIGNSDTEYTWRMNISRLFLAPVNDWNSKLPYHRWDLPAGAWILPDTTVDWVDDNGGGSYWFEDMDNNCEYTQLDNIGTVYWMTVGRYFNTTDILVLLDGPGGDPINPNTDFPYFEDYTFNGLFPDMNSHADWQNLYNILK